MEFAKRAPEGISDESGIPDIAAMRPPFNYVQEMRHYGLTKIRSKYQRAMMLPK